MFFSTRNEDLDEQLKEVKTDLMSQCSKLIMTKFRSNLLGSLMLPHNVGKIGE